MVISDGLLVKRVISCGGYRLQGLLVTVYEGYWLRGLLVIGVTGYECY